MFFSTAAETSELIYLRSRIMPAMATAEAVHLWIGIQVVDGSGRDGLVETRDLGDDVDQGRLVSGNELIDLHDGTDSVFKFLSPRRSACK
jgi:hypothetical protein